MGRLHLVGLAVVCLSGHVRCSKDYLVRSTSNLVGCSAEPVVLEDVALGWEDACLGLTLQSEIKLDIACKEACKEDVTCGVWQFSGEGKNQHCYMGTPSHACRNRHGPFGSSFAATAGQRIQHGKINVLKEATGVEVMGLKAYVFGTGTDIVDQKRCRQACYSDATCGVWQYGESVGSKGCWLEHGPTFLRKGIKNHTDFARDVEAGEFIEHYCPSEPPNQEPGLGVANALMFILCILVLMICLGICILSQQEKDSRQKKTRAVKMVPQDEELHQEAPAQWAPQMSTLVPQRLVEYLPQMPPAYSLIPQPPAFQPTPSVSLPTGPPTIVMEQAPLLVNQGQLV